MADEAPATTPVAAAGDEGDTTPAADDTSTVLTGGDTNPAEGGDTLAADDATGDEPGGADTGDGDTSPESYADFDMPEGSEVDASVLESASVVMKDLGLSQEQGQKLVDWYAGQVQAGSDKQVDAFNQMTGEWQEQSKNDKEFGGDKFEESVGIARAAIDKFGTPELKQLLSDHGVGNHPEVVRFMVRVGQLTQEDNPGNTGGNSIGSKDHASILYGDQQTH